MRVLGKLFRRLFLARLSALHDAGRLAFFGTMAHLADRRAFVRHLSPVQKKRWVVYAKPPFAGPQAVLAYLSRYTHRVAISNRRLINFDRASVTFRYKDYRRDGSDRQRVMTLAVDEFIRRFLLHVLPRGFHRIRHYGLLAGSARKDSLARARKLLAVAPPPDDDISAQPVEAHSPCPCCGGHMIVIETFERCPGHRRMHHLQPGRSSRDPARPATTHCRSTGSAAANARARPLYRQRSLEDLSYRSDEPKELLDRATTRSVRITRGASRIRSARTQDHPVYEIPIAQRPGPAGSFLGDFRTPAGARNSSRELPVRF